MHLHFLNSYVKPIYQVQFATCADWYNTHTWTIRAIAGHPANFFIDPFFPVVNVHAQSM